MRRWVIQNDTDVYVKRKERRMRRYRYIGTEDLLSIIRVLTENGKRVSVRLDGDTQLYEVFILEEGKH